MRQRVMIAMALSCNPSLLIADEPTTALDVTIQAQILELMKRLQRDYGSSILLITHDMGVVSEIAERVVVMYAGSVVEEGPKAAVFRDPQHPYTWGLLGSIPRVGTRVHRLAAIPGAAAVAARAARGLPVRAALRVPLRPLRDAAGAGSSASAPGRADACHLDPAARRGAPRASGASRMTRGCLLEARRPGRSTSRCARRAFRRGPKEVVHAVDGVSLEVRRGETLGIVGESGCGKSTLGRLLVRLHEPTSGTVSFGGTDITTLSRRELRPFRREMQMIFQDPYASLNPRKRVGQILERPVPDPPGRHRAARSASGCSELLEVVGLSPDHVNRYPHEFSGGQRQRIGVARALALNPQLIVADEPVSALDVSIQAQVINLLDDLQDEFDLTYVFIAHDLGVVHHVSDRIAVMYLGVVVELGPLRRALRAPDPPVHRGAAVGDPGDRDARTRTACAAERIVLEGEVPSPIDPPAGCRFHPRCRYATEICRVERPPLSTARQRPLRGLPPPAGRDRERSLR